MEEPLEDSVNEQAPKSYKFIQMQREGDVVRLTLNRPPYNVMNISMLEEIGHALDVIDMLQDTKVVLFQGSDKSFSGGLDIADHTEEKTYQMLEAFHRIFRSLIELEAVSISVVKGMALGGGCELAACCDFCFSAEDAKLGQPEIKVGIFPSVATVLYSRLIGLHKAFEIILTGRVLTAREAESVGLISRSIPPDQLDGEVARWIEFLKGFSAPVLRYTRRAVSDVVNLPFEDALRHVEGIYLNQLMSTEDAKEGLKAFLEKRKPVWKHR
jgi:cyclohexa-1,5-dienecarbonyl-CoA hydratase